MRDFQSGLFGISAFSRSGFVWLWTGFVFSEALHRKYLCGKHVHCFQLASFGISAFSHVPMPYPYCARTRRRLCPNNVTGARCLDGRRPIIQQARGIRQQAIGDCRFANVDCRMGAKGAEARRASKLRRRLSFGLFRGLFCPAHSRYNSICLFDRRKRVLRALKEGSMSSITRAAQCCVAAIIHGACVIAPALSPPGIAFAQAPPPNDSCNAPIAVGDGTRSYSTLWATTDGPDEPSMCTFFGDSHVQSDIWYCYTASCTGVALVSLCGSSYDTKLAVYAGCACPTAPPLACSDDNCGTAVNVQSRVTFNATFGQSYLVRVGGYGGEQGNGQLTIGCNVDPCGDSTGDCFTPSPDGAPGCNDATCCASTCNLDQFCCDVTWNATCAGEAQGVCTGSYPACDPNAGACGTPDSTPGCDNAECCNRVCMFDPYCCVFEWDSTCVQEAESRCFLSCGLGAEDCFTAHLSPGCSLEACCVRVCRNDTYCCAVEWDDVCVFLADEVCGAVTGACCNLLFGTCADYVTSIACSGTHKMWTEGSTCVDAHCEAVSGACCNLLTGGCTDDVPQIGCAGGQRVWTKGAVCGEIDCDAVVGACCDHDPFGNCTEGLTQAACDCPTCEWAKLGSCAELDCAHTSIPTVGSWGLVVLALLLSIGAKLTFRRSNLRDPQSPSLT